MVPMAAAGASGAVLRWITQDRWTRPLRPRRLRILRLRFDEEQTIEHSVEDRAAPYGSAIRD